MNTSRNATTSASTSGAAMRTPVNQGIPGRLGTGITTSGTRSSSSRSTRPQFYLAIAVGRGHASGEVGIACAGIDTPNLTLAQFTDNQNYTKTLSKINLFQPRKVLLSEGLCDVQDKNSLYCEIQKEHPDLEIIGIQRRHFNDRQGLRKVKMLVNEEISSLPPDLASQYYALSAAAAAFKYIELFLGVVYSPKTMRVDFQVSEKTALIDYSTAKHLELVMNNANPNSANTLVGILGPCRTLTGERYLRANILQPPCDKQLILQRLDCVEELVNKPELLYAVQAVLGRLPLDFEQVISNLIRTPNVENSKVLELRVAFVVSLKQTLEVLPALETALHDADHSYFRQLRDECNQPILAELVSRIRSVINEEAHLQKGQAGMRLQRTFLIKSQANNFLDIARKVYCEIVNDINEYVGDLSREHSLPLQLAHNETRGHFIQYKVSDNELLAPFNLPDAFLQVRRQRNMVSFTTTNLIVLDRRAREILKEIDNLSDIIVAQLVTDIREKIGILYKISDAIANLDLLLCFAIYAVGHQAVRPQFSSRVLSITRGHHPILENMNAEPAVPNDTFVSTDVNVNVITGPNMSGKTTYLKQVATLQVMAQMGCFVPAKAASFRIASGIFSRLGCEDNIEGNASSFQVEMKEMSFILKNTGGSPLILIDELGRATSVEEGAAVSWAILESLMKTKAFVLMATHHMFLTKIEALYLNAMNYKMETRETVCTGGNLHGIGNSFRLDYSHVYSRGISDVEHYGLQLAKNSSLPTTVVSRGQDIAKAIMASRQA